MTAGKHRALALFIMAAIALLLMAACDVGARLFGTRPERVCMPKTITYRDSSERVIQVDTVRVAGPHSSVDSVCVVARRESAAR